MSGQAELRKRVWHYIGPELAGACGVAVDELQQFAVGRINLSKYSLNLMALHIYHSRKRYDADTDTLVAV